MNWATANNWAETLSTGAGTDVVDNWRLPDTLQPDATCSSQSNASAPSGVQSFGYNCTGSEMGHLWYNELGNTVGNFMVNTGDFQNFEFYYYRSGSDYVLHTNLAWVFGTHNGFQGVPGKGAMYSAMVVRDGDVLAGLGFARRQRLSAAQIA